MCRGLSDSSSDAPAFFLTQLSIIKMNATATNQPQTQHHPPVYDRSTLDTLKDIHLLQLANDRLEELRAEVASLKAANEKLRMENDYLKSLIEE